MSKKAFSKNIFDTLLQAYRPFIFKLLIVCLLGFIGRFLILSNAQLIGRFYDNNPIVTIESLGALAKHIFFILSISFIMTVIYRTVFSRLSALAVSRLYDETTYRVSRYPLSFFDQNPVGRITTRFSSDYGNIFRLFGGPLAEFLSILFDLISIFILIAMVHSYFLLNLILASLMFIYILKRNQLKLRANRRELSILRSPSVAHFSETVQGHLSIRQTDKSKSFIDRFNFLDQVFLKAKFLVNRNVMQFSAELNIISALLFFANGYLGIHLARTQSLGAGQIAIVLGFTILATNTLQMFFEWYSQFEEALVGVERLDEYLRAPLEEGAFLPTYADFKTHHPQKSKSADKPKQNKNKSDDTLTVENLSFRYPTQNQEDTQPLLSHISFKLKHGEKLGIIGRTGAGKSTLIAALLRLYPIEKGVILINNEYQTDVENHRKQFSLISQDQFFIKGTLRDNLDLFEHYTNKDLENCLQTVGLRFSLDMPIEEKGQNLSHGEKQLISLCRGLLQNAEIFIFDEATANIDPQSEKLIERALKETLSTKTQIRIAHRLQTVQDCDKVLWLESGQIKKIGLPQEVLVAFESTR